jgi:hypothetical protein
MKLYHISQSEVKGYDTYSDLVVCANSEDEARQIHPGSHWNDNPWADSYGSWCKSPDQVKVEYIGEAAAYLEKGIICSSFHAG